ncbi:MAG: hypothetical protein K0S07_226 [Chlamydiales bacterium]|nr:hypothetical protein [Chlamydiales bacterium]
MPILWRYLLKNYLSVFLFSALSFIAVLLTTRLDDIAKFAALSPGISFIVYYVLYQIPYILPIAIPISCLISSMILFQRLSHSQELTAMRALGFSLFEIASSIFKASVLIAICSFYIASEIATTSHLMARQMEQSIKTINPILLLQNQNFLKYRGIYSEVQGSVQGGESATDVLFALKNETADRITLFSFDRMVKQPDGLFATNASIITAIPSSDERQFDHTFVENIETISFPTDGLMLSLKNGWRLNNDHLNLALLKARIKTTWNELAALDPQKIEQKKTLDRTLIGCFSEIFRRLSIACAAITFTLMGMAYGIHISRHPSKKNALTVIALAAFYLISFFTAKELAKQGLLSSFIYILPHLTIASLSLNTLKKISRGVQA